jgi:hypothetical protein
MSVLSCERSASRQTPVVRRQHLPSCPRVSRGSPLLPEGASGIRGACSEPTHTRLDAASRGPGKSEARGGGRSEHARSRCRPDAMQRGGARGGTEGDGVVGASMSPSRRTPDATQRGGAQGGVNRRGGGRSPGPAEVGPARPRADCRGGHIAAAGGGAKRLS